MVRQCYAHPGQRHASERPFVPESIPVPGDRAFKKGVQTFDEVLFPLIRRYREHDDDALGSDSLRRL